LRRSNWVSELGGVGVVVVVVPVDVPDPGAATVGGVEPGVVLKPGKRVELVVPPGRSGVVKPGIVLKPDETVEPVVPPRMPPVENDPMLPREAAPPDDLPPADELAAWPELTLAARMSALQPAAK
jgi:hypothetical protein